MKPRPKEELKPAAAITVETEEQKKEKEELLKLRVKPHSKVSRTVTDKDIPRILEIAGKMQQLCEIPSGLYPAFYAIHHSQVCDKDPLNFWVTFNGDVFVNTIIVKQTQFEVEEPEGCWSFTDRHMIPVKRSTKVEMEFQGIDEETFDKLTPVKLAKLSGVQARVALHECGHGLGKLIYSLK